MIRLANAGDAAQVAEIYRPYCEESAVSFEEKAPDAGEMAARIGKTNERYPFLVDEEGGAVRGYAHASAHRVKAAYRWAVEVTVYLHPDHRGKGLGRALYRELFARLRAQGLVKAYAGILIPNPPSQRLHESMGFTLVGIYTKVGYKHGAWRDVGWWQLSLQPEIDSPPEPTLPSPLHAP
ncbi:MAG TPA: arsinothricin resistance N-acetyltransferase ArsN1 family B [Opitutaceae bacterium]